MNGSYHGGERAEHMADLTFALLEHCQHRQEILAAQLGLTVAEFKTIRSFRDDRTLRAGELARRLRLSSSRLTRILDGLTDKGLVRRELGQTDRRVMEISLTEKGSRLRVELAKGHIQTHQEIIELLPEGAVEAVLFAMEKLRDAMSVWAEEFPDEEHDLLHTEPSTT